jgi:hypothetical protein
MPNKIDKLFQHLILCFENGNLIEIANKFSVPTPIYLEGRLVVLKTVQKLEDAISTYRNSLLVAGWAHSTVRVIAQSIIDDKQMSVWVESAHLDASNHVLSVSTVRYYCIVRNGYVSKIEIAEYLQAPSGCMTKGFPMVSA